MSFLQYANDRNDRLYRMSFGGLDRKSRSLSQVQFRLFLTGGALESPGLERKRRTEEEGSEHGSFVVQTNQDPGPIARGTLSMSQVSL